MRITSKQYAVLLYEMTHQAKGAEIKGAARKFIELLVRNRALNMFSRIARLYCDYYNAQEKVADVEILSARNISGKILHELESGVKKQGKVEWTKKIDRSTLGGVRIRVGDYMLNDTLKERIIQLKRKLTV